MISCYGSCGDLAKGIEFVFDSLLQPDIVTWSALITGFSQSGDYANALVFFAKLLMGGGSADSILLASVLAASSQLAILGPGCEIHGYAVRHERDTEVMVSSALVDMYAKCGFLESGIRVFRNMVDRNIVLYNSVISCLGLYGRADEAFEVFDELRENGLKPDEATFSGLLCACCHAGLVNEGRQYFKRMTDEFGIQNKTEHNVYMVKLLGMDGQLRQAYEFIKTMPEPVDCSVWGALLSCCDAHNANELPEVIADHLIGSKSRNHSYDVMLSNLFASKGRWNDVKQLRVDNGGAKGKIPGISWSAIS
ncbi:pentatricopeptide repeat-containing protein-like [Dorcoceras hygrometricum]|uniref:Pentatricopeptide repeat-containing protein-like n=1 Tax=Dorcoceras hygrometricum TaxID=472368 RepID=A0A2Z7BZ87_9LAMI|nr:pentatricopeptide repeat-containing protein-like [Dorcoceras hygrometricum]